MRHAADRMGNLRRQASVLHALILRNIQTRFGGRQVNFIVALCWPLAHIGMLLLIYSFVDRGAPIGTSSTMFFATGLTPYMFFSYPSRFMMISTMLNRPLTSFPVVKLIDLMIASAILETVAGFAVIAVTAFVLFCCGEHVWPADPAMATAALGGMWILAMGYGLLLSVIVMVLPVTVIVAALFQIILYILSGILFVPASLPERVQGYLSWNPVTQGVQWFREAYFGDAITSEYFPDKMYLLSFGVGLMFAALLLERFVIRRRLD